MPTRKASRQARPDTHKAMSDLGATRKVRFGLAPRFTTPVVIAVSLIIILMGFVVYQSVASSLRVQLDEQGVFAARVAATPELDSWDEDYNTVTDLQERLSVVDAMLAMGGGSSQLTQTDEERIRQQISTHDKSQRRFNQERLASLLGNTGKNRLFLDLWILNQRGEVKASASADLPSMGRPPVEISIDSSPDSRIFSGTYTLSGETHPARYFQHPITDKSKKRVGTAVVVFSKKGIRAALNELRGKIILFCFLGLIATALVAYLTSKIITRPLGTLLKDIRAVAGGDLQHRTFPRSHDEIGTLAVSFDQMTQNLAAAEHMRKDLVDKEHQVSLAQEVQERLFQTKLPDVQGLQLDAANKLAGELSADLFDAQLLNSGKVGLLVMTASGRGVPAAIVLSMARSLFRARALEEDSPTEALKVINSLLAPDLRRGMYVSALYAVLDLRDGRGSLASAGHRYPALQFVAAGPGLKPVQADGIAMGLDKGPVFERSLTETPFQLDPGDRLILATEGASALVDANGDPLPDESFMRLALAASKQGASAQALVEAVESKLGATTGDHDLTLVQASRQAG